VCERLLQAHPPVIGIATRPVISRGNGAVPPELGEIHFHRAAIDREGAAESRAIIASLIA
jgi:hypothetical protein